MKRIKHIDRLKSLGNSKYIIIPKHIREDLKLMTGDRIEMILWKSKVNEKEDIKEDNDY